MNTYQKRVIPLGVSGKYPAALVNYLEGRLAGHHLYPHSPDLTGLAQAMSERMVQGAAMKISRADLVAVIKAQYVGLDLSVSQQTNIALLEKPTTFTVTTGHQLNLMTGPLYVPLKLASVVNLCRTLKQRYPTHDFVPVYWMATEDHDKDEVDHFSLFGKQIKWETDQTGPVGRFKWDPHADWWTQLPQDTPAELIAAYKNADTWAKATRQLVQYLFAETGLLCLDPDDKVLKQGFKSIAVNDALEQLHTAPHQTISQRIEHLGYKTQVNARPINLFYIGPSPDGRVIRERLVQEDNQYKVLNSPVSFTREQLAESIDNNPDYWSPNVVLRPLYQEAILPNIAYLGGPAEVAYWLQMAELFSINQLPMPVVLPRGFAQIITKSVAGRITKAGLRFEDFMLDQQQLKSLVLSKQATTAQVDFAEEYKLTAEAFNRAKRKAEAADQTLVAFVEAQEAQVMKQLDAIEKRINKALERKHETAINQVLNLREKLLPGDGLQERSDNILNFLINSPELIQLLVNQLDPLNYGLHVFEEVG